jgi:hypothetical protein
MYRNKFNAFNRQVEENKPTQIDMSFVDRTKSAADADISTQNKAGSETVGKMGPDISTFLPTFQNSLGDNAEARNATANNLKAYLPEYKPAEIDTAMEDEAMSLLGQQNRAGYLTALMENRGGGMSGANRLDAAILDRSGAGRQAFEQGRQKLSGYTDMGNAAETELNAQYEGKKGALKDAQNKLIEAIGGAKQGLTDKGQAAITAAQSRAIPLEEIAAIKQEAQRINPNLPIVDLKDYSPFIDREMSFEESLSGADADQYNYLAELLGKSPTMFRQQDPGVNREGLLRALLQEADAQRQREEKAARDAMAGKATAQEQRKKDEQRVIDDQTASNKRHNAGTRRSGRAGDA